MKVVLDASFALNFLLPDEGSAQVIRVFEEYLKGKIHFVSLKILSLEVANGLKYAVKAKRIKQETAFEILEKFIKFEIEFLETDLQKVLAVALDHDLSIYDASYLYLAENFNLSLLTLDAKLKKLSSQQN